MRKFVLFLGLTLCFTPALNAQGSPVFKRVLKKWADAARNEKPAAPKAAAKASARKAQKQAKQALHRRTVKKPEVGSVLARRTAQARVNALKNNAQRSVGLVSHPVADWKGTVFVIQENFNGQKYLWGVSAAHVAKMFFDDVTLHFTVDGVKHSFKPLKTFRGSHNGADVAVFLLPPEAAKVVKPLSVSPRAIKAGAETFSVGYGRSIYHRANHRTVLAANPIRIVTSYELAHKPRNGYCGSPLFNRYNEVIGVHCGSILSDDEFLTRWQMDLPRLGYPKQDISIATPIAWAQMLINEYRSGIKAGTPLLFNGVKVTTLLPGQHLLNILPYANKKLRLGISAGPYTDPAHLEKGLNATDADGVIITLYNETPLAGQDAVQKFILNLKTKRVRLHKEGRAYF